MGSSRILVVEDDARLGATLQRVLTAEGQVLRVALIVLLRKPREAFT